MASTDYAPARNLTASPLRRALRDRGSVVLVFGMAFVFHLAVLFNLLP